MNRFIIDETILNSIRDGVDAEWGDGVFDEYWGGNAVRSHPYQSEQCVYWGKKDGKDCCSLLIPHPDLYIELTDKIRKDERDKVLDRLVAFRMVCNVKIEDETPGNYYTTLDAWKEFELLLEELRQAGSP